MTVEHVGIVGTGLIGTSIGLALARSEPGRIDRLVVVNGWARLDPYTDRCFNVRLDLLRGSGPRARRRAERCAWRRARR